MTVKWGSTACTVIKWGGTNCTAVYWGSTKVFPDIYSFSVYFVGKNKTYYWNYPSYITTFGALVNDTTYRKSTSGNYTIDSAGSDYVKMGACSLFSDYARKKPINSGTSITNEAMYYRQSS